MEMSKTYGCDARSTEKPGAKPRPVVMVELIATVALALSTLVMVTAVSIGIARADTIGVADHASAPVALALFIGLLLSGMGGLTALMAKGSERE
jgi:hypothetical protein